MAEFSQEEISNKVIDIVSKKLGIEKQIVIDSSSFEDLGADSLDMVEIIMKLEEVFSIEINDEDAEKLSSLDQVVNYIQVLRKQ